MLLFYTQFHRHGSCPHEPVLCIITSFLFNNLYFKLHKLNNELNNPTSFTNNRYFYIMIRLNNDTPNDILQDVKIGDMVTDTFSKTGLVESIEIKDDGLYRIYEFNLVTGRTITIKRGRNGKRLPRKYYLDKI